MKKIVWIFVFFGILQADNGLLNEFGIGVGFNHYHEPSLMHMDEVLLNANAKLGYRYQFAKVEADADIFTTIGRYYSRLRDNTFEENAQNDGHATTITMSQIFDGQLKAGVDLLAFSPKADLFLQSGIGYRYLYHNIGAGFKRAQIYLYVPIELEGAIKASPSFAWTYLLGYKHLIEGRNASLIGSASAYEDDYRAKQDKGFGLKGSFGWKNFGNDSSFARLVVDYWKIDDANTKQIVNYLGVPKDVREPKNYTISVYVQYGWSF